MIFHSFFGNPTCTLLFDYDGVIADSMEIKNLAYKYSLSKFNIPSQVIDRVQLLNAGLSRYKVLEAIYHEWTGLVIPSETLEEVSRLFDSKDKELEKNITIYEDAIQFIKKSSIFYQLILITGIRQAVIERSLKNNGLINYFEEIKGSPTNKEDHLTNFINERKIYPPNCFFLGDGLVDQKAAEKCNIKFIGVDRGKASFIVKSFTHVIQSFSEIKIDQFGVVTRRAV
ncbi:MAG: HAD hydrolase-like protein [Oceanospirillaceae bacterium]